MVVAYSRDRGEPQGNAVYPSDVITATAPDRCGYWDSRIASLGNSATGTSGGAVPSFVDKLSQTIFGIVDLVAISGHTK